MSSPYVRRQRLATEVRQLRKNAGFTSVDALAKHLGVTRREIQAIEGAERDRTVDFELLAKILPATGVDEDTPDWRMIMKIGRDASDGGWWKSAGYRGIGPRQALAAELEYGATQIHQYEPTLVPGLLQTEAYCRGLVRAVASETGPVNAEAVVAGRLRRQEQAETSNTALDIVVEEIAIRRSVAPAAVMADQLRHLVDLADSPRITLRVLPVNAEFIDVRGPREGFMRFRYADPDDPAVVLLDTVTRDIVRTEPDEVTAYQQLIACCSDRALSPEQSRDLIADAAKAFTKRHISKKKTIGKGTQD